VKPWRRRWQRWRRQNRVLIGLYLTLLGLAGVAYWLFARMRGLPPEELTNRLLVFLLWWFDLTLIGVVLFILVRNLTKLLLERRRGIFGTRFRTTLLLSYLAVIIVPTGLLFVLGALLLSHGAASWFAAPVEGMAQAGSELAEEVRGETEARVRHDARVIAEALRGMTNSGARVAALERFHATLGNDLTGLWQGGASVVELVDPTQRALLRLPELDSGALGRPGARGDRFGGTMVVRGWEPVGGGVTVVVGEVMSPTLVEAQARLAAAGAAYERLKLERPAITATTVLGFGGLALVVVFAATWFGLYLARRFTEPLLAVVASTERVVAGDALEEVPIPAQDEVGLLVESFNAMARQVKERQQALEAAVRRLDAVLGAVRTGVLTLDPERRVVRGNAAAATLLGMPRLADEWVELDDLGAGMPRLVETIRTARGAVRSSLTVSPGGLPRALEMAVVPLGVAERPEGWVVALEDLTALLRAQRQAAWSEVARRIAHQIKNPLTPIRLAAERIARRGARGGDDLETVIEQGCEAIIAHVQAMQQMVDAFARYAKFPPVSRRPCRLADLLHKVGDLYRSVRPTVVVEVDPAIQDVEVLLDPDQLRQALGNLIDNAVEASSTGGEVRVRAWRDGGEIVVEVVDTGEGIAVTDAETLFQPFYSTKGRGSGMGLAIVQRIVADHGGTVRLEPNAPSGARAVVRLPADAA
jgi:two-component system, NtrC family, nitrogen regulation sensor histidine kinase NtrY